MGREIENKGFTSSDFKQFKDRLREETAILMKMFLDEDFAACEKTYGFELESWLVDKKGDPVPRNSDFIKTINNDLVVPELSKYNVELNSKPQLLGGRCFKESHNILNNFWSQYDTCSRDLGVNTMMIGSLPTLRKEMLIPENMSKMDRYEAMNEQIMHLRNDESVRFCIEGRERLELMQKDIMLEAASTSLQVHLQIPPCDAERYYNASLIASPIIAAVCANTPYFLGKDLWDESRIAIFEQALELPGFQNVDNDLVKRVSLGSGYLRKSIFEIFLENLDSFPIVLPVLFDSKPERLEHLHLHNGTIWRWNRPIVDFNKAGEPTLRIEHRVPSSGPTVPDIVANMALFIGLVHYLAEQETAPELLIEFHDLRKGFYTAAKDGLDAEIMWLDGEKIILKELMEQELLPNISTALLKLGIAKEDVAYYIDDIIKNRVATKQTGAMWQRKFIDKYGSDFNKMTRAYLGNQQKGHPVYQW